MPKPSRILVFDGHPNDQSFCRALGEAYEQGALEGGAEVRRLVLAHLAFDPILHHGFQKRMELEPDLLKAQQDILWCDHLVIVHPVWWGTYPALLKGFFDRAFLPGFAFRYRPDSVWWDKLLTGRSAHIVYTVDQPLWFLRFVNGRPAELSLKRMILGFCGIAPIRSTGITPVRGSSDAFREKWVGKVRELGRLRK